MTLPIDSDILIPPRRGKPKGAARNTELPDTFDKLEVGQSIFVPGVSQRAVAAAAEWNRLHRPKQLETRAMESDVKYKTHGVRVWRTR